MNDKFIEVRHPYVKKIYVRALELIQLKGEKEVELEKLNTTLDELKCALRSEGIYL